MAFVAEPVRSDASLSCGRSWLWVKSWRGPSLRSMGRCRSSRPVGVEVDVEFVFFGHEVTVLQEDLLWHCSLDDHGLLVEAAADARAHAALHGALAEAGGPSIARHLRRLMALGLPTISGASLAAVVTLGCRGLVRLLSLWRLRIPHLRRHRFLIPYISLADQLVWVCQRGSSAACHVGPSKAD